MAQPITRLGLAQSINSALTDEYLREVELGLVDVYLDEDTATIHVAEWDSDDPDVPPAARYRIEVKAA